MKVIAVNVNVKHLCLGDILIDNEGIHASITNLDYHGGGIRIKLSSGIWTILKDLKRNITVYRAE